jgi:PAS domain S-box-containing protein
MGTPAPVQAPATTLGEETSLAERLRLVGSGRGDAVAVLSSGVALAIALGLDRWDLARPGPLFLAAVVVSAWYGGMRPALLSTLLGILAINYFFEAPAYSLAISSLRTGVSLVVFGLVALLVSTLHARARAAQQRAETALAQLQVAEARYRHLFENAADAFILIGPDGRYLETNQAASDLLGYSREELLGLRVGDTALNPGEARQHFTQLQQLGEGRGEGEVRRKDGTTVPVEWWAVALPPSTGPLYIRALRDVSARRTAERQQHELIAMVGHELRNPLTLINGYAQLLQQANPGGDPGVDAIARQAAHMDRILGDLLDLARLETGRLELRRRPVDLVALTRLATEHTRALSPEHVVQVNAPAQRLTGEWDIERLTQVLQNLLTNAVKYSAPGSKIEVCLADRGDEAEVVIRDEGQGVPADALPRIFDRFYRGPDASRGTPGQGLGLYVTRWLVEAHGGRIRAESAGPGQGTTVTFNLPYRPADVTAPGAA